MRFGANSFGTISFGDSDADESSEPVLVDFLGNQDWPRTYLLDAAPYDPVAESITAVRGSLGLKRPILSGVHWPAILKNAADVQVELFDDDENGQGRSQFGNIELLIGDGEHDDITGYLWDGRTVEVLMGREDLDFTDYQQMVLGTAEDIAFDGRKLSIVFRGQESRLDVPVNTDAYAGTGDEEGDADIEGVLKPKAFGFVFNASPVLIDRTNLVYQWHDGPVEGVYRVLDGGAELVSQGDVADITATSVDPGYYKTQNIGGFVKLGATPASVLTLDGWGCNDGGYVDKAADICKRLVLDYTDLIEANLDLPSFYAAAKDNRSECGVYITSGTVASVVTDLMQSIGGAWCFDRLGKMVLAQFRYHRSKGTISGDDIVRGTFKRLRTVAPTWERRLQYARNFTPMTEDQLIGSATDARKTLSVQEYKEYLTSDTDVKVRRKAARSVTKATLLRGKLNAAAEAARQFALFSGDFDRIEITARNQQFLYRVGQTITLDYSRFGFDAQDMIITGLRENTTTQQTVFTLWG